ncbi:Zinc finger C-x8-C-x5-C-x3-H type domain containing protein, putative [Babesia bigemina]|uniref:Zinc finger C-x8-C-x5-C-x3-H type domain containing protein, putative n=1 Tax=Babesia bigemina TaxID=5866 RepID=A0A061CYZ3_BABBI|nr:Zinc finger C-x8-C-x5-C-x3-H type domain containing protein, putative [Babesia bigemina]CDR93836.1 Zinc finger C-x8-C-x5-C-x3-H type domain containing protein, putative [Babesia bigemina]|eukprot:XP_012766022.1 Zinc finger C-x8-C-x5-C-x3-H type domain containing protein, putative [Babesia bigemina]
MDGGVPTDPTPYNDYYDDDLTPLGLPVTLNDLLDELSPPPSAHSKPPSSKNDEHYSSLRHYVEGLSSEEVDETINDVLKNLSLRAGTSPLPPPGNLVGPLQDDATPTLDFSNSDWTSQTGRFSFGENHTALRHPTFNPLEQAYDSRDTFESLSTHWTSYYDDANRSECDFSSGNAAYAATEVGISDMAPPGLSASSSTLYSWPDARSNSCKALTESLRNIQFQVAKVEQALTCAMNETSPAASRQPPPPAKPPMFYKRANDENSMISTQNAALMMGVKLNAPNEFWRTSICKYWQRGVCENTNCNFAHGKKELKATIGVWKTTPCHHWKNGTCRVGRFCRHAHGEAELQPMNMPVHLLRNRVMNALRASDRFQRKRNPTTN